jgi:hypothetical protein
VEDLDRSMHIARHLVEEADNRGKNIQKMFTPFLGSLKNSAVAVSPFGCCSSCSCAAANQWVPLNFCNNLKVTFQKLFKNFFFIQACPRLMLILKFAVASIVLLTP